MFERRKYKTALKELKASITDMVEEAKGTPMEAVTRLELQRNLRSGDFSHRLGGAFGLGELGSPDDVELLVQALGDPEPPVREEAAMALGKIGDMRATPALEELRKREGDPKVKLAATKAETSILKAERGRLRG